MIKKINKLKNGNCKRVFYLLFIFCVYSCDITRKRVTHAELHENFNDYWYRGEAEITSFELHQVRYGEVHKGEAVLIFVTEPFSVLKHVKPDDWESSDSKNVGIMKLNMTKNFLTGIYPYSMMMSTFKAVHFDHYPRPFKVSTSLQEWCGQTYMQLNLQDTKFRVQGFSYFESEGDTDATIPSILLEDELWTTIRLSPQSLPVGDFEVLPSTFYLRLSHGKIKPQRANGKLMTVKSSNFYKYPHAKYQLAYQERSITIYFNETFPHEILGWEEIPRTNIGETKLPTTIARRIHIIKSPYWQKNKNTDRVLRKQLGLGIR